MQITGLQGVKNNEGDLEKERFAMDVLSGLSCANKNLPAKYFYDDRGSELFQKITQTEDYYPTRVEYEILESLQSQLPELFDAEVIDVIELGAGDGHKSQLLLNGFLRAGKTINYYPVDISAKAMELLTGSMMRHSRLHINPVISEYFEGLRLIRQQSQNPILVLFLGSNIGNFDRLQNQQFLRLLWKSLADADYALIGFDMKKDVNVLNRAYNDAAGYTRDFNLNLLERINRELGADFDSGKFQHYGSYNPVLGAMESYLVATEAQEVYVSELERSFSFSAYEALHLEYSFKFSQDDLLYLAQHTGFDVVKHFTDQNRYFTDSLWRVAKGREQWPTSKLQLIARQH